MQNIGRAPGVIGVVTIQLRGDVGADQKLVTHHQPGGVEEILAEIVKGKPVFGLQVNHGMVIVNHILN